MIKQQRMTYADAETRGKVRAWKTVLADRYQMFDRAYRSKEIRNIIHDFVKRGSAVPRGDYLQRLRRDARLQECESA
jgi:hypothetical protein